MKKNKGFSLVELIIVIAIMAILVGVIAPQLIRYIEKANISADVTTLDSVRSALTYAASDPEFATSTDTLPSTGKFGSLNSSTIFGKIATKTVDPAGIKFKSKSYKTKKAADVTYGINSSGQVCVALDNKMVIDYNGNVTTPSAE